VTPRKTVELGRIDLKVKEVVATGDYKKVRPVLVLGDDSRWEVAVEIGDDIVRRWRAGERDISVRTTYTIEVSALRDPKAPPRQGTGEEGSNG
jgi:hypothetical protein